MAKGKLILICQFGGEFIINADGTMLYSGGEARAVNINHDTLFEDLKLEVAKTCNLDQKTVFIKYFLPGNKRNLITVKNDKDVTRMVDFHNSSITADVFVTGTTGFDRSALKIDVERPTSSKKDDLVKYVVPATPASPSLVKRTLSATAKDADKPAKLPPRRASAKATSEAVLATRPMTSAKATSEAVLPTRPMTRSTARASTDVVSGGPADTVESSDDNSEGSTRETSPSTRETSPSISPSEKADDEDGSDYNSDYVPSKTGGTPNSQTDVNTSPAGSVKKRKRTASAGVSAKSPTIVSGRDDNSRETKSQKKCHLPNAENSGARKSVRKSTRKASELDDSRKRKSRRKDGRKSRVKKSDHSLGACTLNEEYLDNPSPIAISEDDEGEKGDENVEDDATRKIIVSTWEGAIIGVDQVFGSVHEFRDALQKYAVANGFAYKLEKNDNMRVIGVCVTEGCSWKIHAELVPPSQKFKIEIMNNTHTCDYSRRAAHANDKDWLVNAIKERLQKCPNLKHKEIADGIMRDYGVELSYMQLWRGIEDAREQLHGSPEDSYNKLPWFCEKVVETNPGSFSKLIISDDKRFHSLFVSFYASICGFQKGCRPLIFLESTPLKSKYQEVLLTANAIDGNDGFFPVAFAVADIENDDRWHWFLEQLKSVVSDSKPITFVSDRDKNLRKSVLDVFENAHHGYSMYHLIQSFRRNDTGRFIWDGKLLLASQLLEAAHAVRLGGFKKSMEQIMLQSPQSYKWVMQIEAQYWATYSFKGERYNYITEDVGGKYAKLMEDSGELPILHKIDALINMLTNLVEDARLSASQWTTKLTPVKEKYLQEENLRARGLSVLASSYTVFEVRDDLTHVVDTSNWSCTCLGWKETGLPCRHALAVFNSTGKNVYDYCSEYFSADFYRTTYYESINHVPIHGKPVDTENVDSTVNENQVEKDEVNVGDENPVEKDGEDAGIENPVEGRGSGEKEGGDLSVGNGIALEKVGETSADVEPVERERDKENEGIANADGESVEKVASNDKDKNSSAIVMPEKKDKEKGEKKGGDDLVLPPISSKAPPVQQKDKVSINKTAEEEGKRTKQVRHNKNHSKADLFSV